MKSIVALALLGFLAACTTPTFTKEMSPHPQMQMSEQELFIAALDQFSATNKLEMIEAFRQQYPDSSLAPYAETISLYAQELDARKEQLTTLEQEHQLLQAQLAVAKQENKQLSEKIEQLKKLLIELEQRPQ